MRQGYPVEAGGQESGCSPRKVVLAAYSDNWAKAFSAEAKLLRETLDSMALGIEHFGSTSIPNLKSKPIIDIVVGVRDLSENRAFKARVSRCGYEFVEELVKKYPDMRYYHKGPREWRLFHLHVVVFEGPTWKRYLGFRDLLRANRSIALEYEKIKEELARRYPLDRDAYTAEKAPFIDSLMRDQGFEKFG